MHVTRQLGEGLDDSSSDSQFLRVNEEGIVQSSAPAAGNKAPGRAARSLERSWEACVRADLSSCWASMALKGLTRGAS